jgi:hypothetical protein
VEGRVPMNTFQWATDIAAEIKIMAENAVNPKTLKRKHINR